MGRAGREELLLEGNVGFLSFIIGREHGGTMGEGRSIQGAVLGVDSGSSVLEDNDGTRFIKPPISAIIVVKGTLCNLMASGRGGIIEAQCKERAFNKVEAQGIGLAGQQLGPKLCRLLLLLSFSWCLKFKEINVLTLAQTSRLSAVRTPMGGCSERHSVSS